MVDTAVPGWKWLCGGDARGRGSNTDDRRYQGEAKDERDRQHHNPHSNRQPGTDRLQTEARGLVWRLNILRL
ncbi:MAG: hypothetical protein AAB092_05805, partial [Chloroflexota bacterium]